MTEVRPRTRGKLARAREVQGMLVMPGLESEGIEDDPASVPMQRRGAEGGSSAARSKPARRGRATAPAQAEIRPLPHRLALAAWPDEWRERWGRRANDLEEAGLSWRDAEGRAFVEVWNEWRVNASVVARN